MHTLFHGYLPAPGGIRSRPNGSLVAWETGATTTFGLENAEVRSMLFLGPAVISMMRQSAPSSPGGRHCRRP